MRHKAHEEGDRRKKAEHHQRHELPLVMSNKKTIKNSTF
jgi:hypothetical protein